MMIRSCAMAMIRKGQARRIGGRDIQAPSRFVAGLPVPEHRMICGAFSTSGKHCEHASNFATEPREAVSTSCSDMRTPFARLKECAAALTGVCRKIP